MLDGRGAETAFWTDCSRIWAADRPSGGRFGAPYALPSAGSGGRHGVSYAEAANATTVVLWFDYVGVYAAARDPGGSFRSVALTSATDRAALRPEPTLTAGISQPMVAVNARGDAVAGWVEALDHYHEQYAMAAYKRAGGDWQAPVRLAGPPTYTSTPGVTIDAAGTATVAWTDGGNAVYAASGRDESFGAPEVVAAHAGCGVDAATDAGGTTFVAWHRYDSVCQGASESGGHIEVASRPPGGRFTGRFDVLGGAPWITRPELAAQHDGVLVAWLQGSAHDNQVFEAHTLEAAPPDLAGSGTPPDAATSPAHVAPADAASTPTDSGRPPVDGSLKTASTSPSPARRRITLALPPGRVSLRSIRRHGLPVTATCRATCSVLATLRAGHTLLSRRTVRLRAGKRLTLHLRPTGPAARQTVPGRRWFLSVVAAAAAGAERRSARRVITVAR